MKTVLKTFLLIVLSLPIILIVFLLSPFIELFLKEEQDGSTH